MVYTTELVSSPRVNMYEQNMDVCLRRDLRGLSALSMGVKTIIITICKLYTNVV